MTTQYGIEQKLDTIRHQLDRFTDEVKYDLIPELNRIASSMEELVDMLKPNFKDNDESPD